MSQNSASLKTSDDYIAAGHTPMMAQYHMVKAAHPDCLLFYRMGDFYEMFFNDAIVAAKILDLTLTKRGKTQGDDIPMCGVPFHSADAYIARLIRAGHKVGICEQIETPEEAKKRGGSKALVQRDVIRVVTPGTLIEENLLDSKTNNFLVSVISLAGQTGIATVDVSTGDLFLQSCEPSQAVGIIMRLSPGEIICSDQTKLYDNINDLQAITTLLPSALFTSEDGINQLNELFPESADQWGHFNRAEIASVCGLLRYIHTTQKGKIPFLTLPRHLTQHDFMDIDPSTVRSLELIRTQTGQRAGSLIDTIDMTITGAGARLLQTRLMSPLRDLSLINIRLDEISSFIGNYQIVREIRQALKATPDLERALARISAQRGGPRDLAALRDGLSQAIIIRAFLLDAEPSPSLQNLAHQLLISEQLQTFYDLLQEALTPSPPLFVRDGHFVREGFCLQLDQIRSLRTETTRMVASLQTKYAELTGIDSLKITYNNILGYFIEVPARRADTMMVKNGEHENPFIHRQTMANAVRFTTPELSQLEQDISSSSDKAQALEETYFADWVGQAIKLATDISHIARGLAMIDVAAAAATLAVERNYTRPVISNDHSFTITGGRHPVVEYALKQHHKDFIPNNCHLNGDEKLWLLTGPNMAGKSTFLRQNALIAIMAQAGLYVPAQSAHIGLIDKVFSRVGASDDLARGHSTFMMEMVETAAILKNATSTSLVILDEVGRGTSTFDGLSLAWSIVEYLHNTIACRGLFATHYHELTNLRATLSALTCYTMDVKEWKGDIIFLHTVKIGTADRSYGIHVAKLAGLPNIVLTRAESVLNLLENKKNTPSMALSELPLFNATTPVTVSEAEELLETIEPDELTPREAHDILYQLKAKAQKKSN